MQRAVNLTKISAENELKGRGQVCFETLSIANFNFNCSMAKHFEHWTFYASYVTLFCLDWCKRCLNHSHMGALWKLIRHSWLINRTGWIQKNQYTTASTCWKIIKVLCICQMSPLKHTTWEQAHIYSRTNVWMTFSLLCKCWIIMLIMP